MKLLVSRDGQPKFVAVSAYEQIAAGKKVIAAVGGGGKTSLLTAIAASAPYDMRVVIATTTKMYRPSLGFWDAAKLPESFPPGTSFCGVPIADGKMTGSIALMGELAARCDLLLVEADGSKRLPIKVPAAHEPVLPPADLIVGAAGVSAVGKMLKDVCHRADLAANLLAVPLEHPVTETDVAFLLSDAAGQRKQVGDTPYLAVVGQADCNPKAAEQICRRLQQQNIDCLAVSHKIEQEGF